jgi:hypothetical protein
VGGPSREGLHSPACDSYELTRVLFLCLPLVSLDRVGRGGLGEAEAMAGLRNGGEGGSRGQLEGDDALLLGAAATAGRGGAVARAGAGVTACRQCLESAGCVHGTCTAHVVAVLLDLISIKRDT